MVTKPGSPRFSEVAEPVSNIHGHSDLDYPDEWIGNVSRSKIPQMTRKRSTRHKMSSNEKPENKYKADIAFGGLATFEILCLGLLLTVFSTIAFRGQFSATSFTANLRTETDAKVSPWMREMMNPNYQIAYAWTQQENEDFSDWLPTSGQTRARGVCSLSPYRLAKALHDLPKEELHAKDSRLLEDKQFWRLTHDMVTNIADLDQALRMFENASFHPALLSKLEQDHTTWIEAISSGRPLPQLTGYEHLLGEAKIDVTSVLIKVGSVDSYLHQIIKDLQVAGIELDSNLHLLTNLHLKALLKLPIVVLDNAKELKIAFTRLNTLMAALVQIKQALSEASEIHACVRGLQHSFRSLDDLLANRTHTSETFWFSQAFPDYLTNAMHSAQRYVTRDSAGRLIGNDEIPKANGTSTSKSSGIFATTTEMAVLREEIQSRLENLQSSKTVAVLLSEQESLATTPALVLETTTIFHNFGNMPAVPGNLLRPLVELTSNTVEPSDSLKST
ncbi:hypothetical protein MMC25_004167 [Agyrium rufum]|nr:hypothetical protein [Agyrium rufum]